MNKRMPCVLLSTPGGALAQAMAVPAAQRGLDVIVADPAKEPPITEETVLLLDDLLPALMLCPDPAAAAGRLPTRPGWRGSKG